jgi:hypothetical protein
MAKMIDPDEPLPWYMVALIVGVLLCMTAAFVLVIGSALGWWSLA